MQHNSYGTVYLELFPYLYLYLELCSLPSIVPGGTILAANTIPNTGKFAKMVHSDFFCEDGGTLEVLITLT